MNETIENRIRALLAKASSTDSEHEAAAFAAKAQELLARHNLNAAAVERRGQARPEAVVEAAHALRYSDPWRIRIWADAGALYFCGGYVHRFTRRSRSGVWTQHRGFTLVGKPHNLAVAASMAGYLDATVVRLGRAYSTDRAQYLGFERGCGMRVAERLRALTPKAPAAPATAALPPGEHGGLPALYATERSLVAAHMAGLDLRDGRRTSTDLSGHAAAAGRRAAEAVSLHAQVGGGGRLALPGARA